MIVFDKLNYGAVFTPLIFLALLLILINLLTGNDVGLGNAFGFNTARTIDFSFAAAGDWGCSSATKNTVNNIIQKNPQMLLGLGDFGYEESDCWLKLIEPISQKVKIVIGNHDHLDYITTTDYDLAPERLQMYMRYFNLTKQFYSFNYQNVHFVAMSTEIPYEKSSEQYNFVIEDLQKTVSNSSIDWIVVFYHRVAYASESLIHGIGLLRDTYHPLFEKYGVDIVLQAHSHNYQRSYPIKFNSDDSLKPFVADKNATNYIDPDGQIFAIVGTGGAKDTHAFTGSASSFTAVQFKAYGFLNIDVLNNGTMLDGKFYENNGSIMDHFTILKPKKENKEINSSTSSNSLSSTSLSLSSNLSKSVPKLVNGYERKFKIESVASGLKFPTDIAFLGIQDFLVLDKDDGTVKRVVNGRTLEKPLLDVNVANKIERGLLGISVIKEANGSTYAFLYYTESKSDGNDVCPRSDQCNKSTQPIGNRLYRYDLIEDGTKLVRPKLILDLPATPGPAHNGGKMIVDANKNIYLIAGDVMASDSQAQNYKNGQEPDGTGGILKINTGGNLTGEGVLGNHFPLNLYYAYGIRNGFGLDLDPLTGNLWDTENGPEFGDEINLIKPGFNSGWKDIQGIWNHKGGKAEKGPLNLGGLVDFGGKGRYSDPEFTWNNTVAPTALKFFDSDQMGNEYNNSLFVGDMQNGNLYQFNLNDNRTSLVLDGTLADKVADSPAELEKVIFAEGFGGITDLEVGPDGHLYVLSIGKGAIYRILPK